MNSTTDLLKKKPGIGIYLWTNIKIGWKDGYMTIIATGAIPYLDNAEVGFRRDCAHEQ